VFEITVGIKKSSNDKVNVHFIEFGPCCFYCFVSSVVVVIIIILVFIPIVVIISICCDLFYILGPKAKQLEGEECPLHVKHPPTGEEFALGCGFCRNAHTF
jgi:hypothetical protein